MNQTIFLMLGLLGLVGIGSVVSSNDDDHAPEGSDEDPRDRDTFIVGTEGDDTLTGTDGDDASRVWTGTILSMAVWATT